MTSGRSAIGVVWLLLAAGSTQAAELDLPLPDAPAVVDLGQAREPERTSAIVDRLRPTADPAENDSPGTARVAAAPPLVLPLPEMPPEISLPADEVLAGAIELRLADPKLPLPPRLSARDRAALAAAYAATGHRPLWVADGAWTEAARAVQRRLGLADEDGLDPSRYPVPVLSVGRGAPKPTDLAEAELKLSAAAYLYARDARGGRIEPFRIGGLVTPKLELPGLAAVLVQLRTAPDAGAALQGYNPAYPGYAALRAKLADLRSNRPAGLVRASGRREAMAIMADERPPEARVASSARLEGDIVANMERWRWLPAMVPVRSVDVNVPEFKLRLVEGGRVLHETRVITGKSETPTPIFSDEMEYVIVNPSWFVPPSILRKDPGIAGRNGYVATRRGKQTIVRQPPGPTNALGYIKFMFPNDHAVYLHDTPNRNLFGSAQRAFSHGCVRVEHPFALGGQILGPAWSEPRLKSLIGRGERQINLAEKLPVNLSYFTVAVDEWGELRSFPDIYGYHRRVRVALGLGA